MFGPKWRAPEFTGIRGWVNSTPLEMKNLRGKVVLVDFWTYTCINCLRTLPYLKRWHAKYAKFGLVIVGVHSPEFDFEQDPKQVERAVKRLGLKYPVAVDSDMETWKAFGNQYWPAKYLIDKEGYVTYTHFGEGGYEQTERILQEALGIEAPLENEKPKTYIFDQSPETYAGFSRNMGLGSGMVCDKENCNVYIDQGEHEPNTLYPHGQWVQEKEYLRLEKAPGLLSYKFNAREVNVVMEPLKGDIESKKSPFADIVIDGKKIGKVKIDRSDMFTIFEDKKYATRELTLVFHGLVKVYAFTFG